MTLLYILTGLLITALLAILGGGAGLIASRKDVRWKLLFASLLVLGAAILLGLCKLTQALCEYASYLQRGG